MYDLYFDSINRFIFWQSHDLDIADDLTSEVFIRAWQKLDDFDGRYPQAWLFRIARNLLTDHWRKKPVLPLHEKVLENLPDDRPLAADQLDQLEQNVTLKRALASLPVKIRQIIILRVLEGLSAKQTGQRLNISEANVRVLQHRGLKTLRQWYEKNN